MLDEAALLALAVADEETIGAYLTSTRRALLALAAKSVRARNTLPIEPEVTLFALLALKAIITLLTIDVYEVRAGLAKAVFDKASFNTTLTCECIKSE